MGSGCGNLIVASPSSSGQLPVPVALNAKLPTLFSPYYTRFAVKCKEGFCFFSKFPLSFLWKRPARGTVCHPDRGEAGRRDLSDSEYATWVDPTTSLGMTWGMKPEGRNLSQAFSGCLADFAGFPPNRGSTIDLSST